MSDDTRACEDSRLSETPSSHWKPQDRSFERHNLTMKLLAKSPTSHGEKTFLEYTSDVYNALTVLFGTGQQPSRLSRCCQHPPGFLRAGGASTSKNEWPPAVLAFFSMESEVDREEAITDSGRADLALSCGFGRGGRGSRCVLPLRRGIGRGCA